MAERLDATNFREVLTEGELLELFPARLKPFSRQTKSYWRIRNFWGRDLGAAKSDDGREGHQLVALSHASPIGAYIWRDMIEQSSEG